MKNQQDKQLDRLLQDWSSSVAVGTEDLESLRVQLSDRLESGVAPEAELVPPLDTRDRRQVMAVVFSVAAMLLIAVGLWRSMGKDTPEEKQPEQAFFQPVEEIPRPWQASTREHQVKLLHEYRAVFGRQLSWVVESGGQAKVGLLDSSPPIISAETEHFVSVRLTLWSRPDDGSQWKQLQACNVLAASEEFVQVAPATDDEAILEIWAYPLNDEMISIDLRYQPSRPSSGPIDQSIIQRLGEFKNLSFEKDGVEYRLDQTADLIRDGDLG